MKRSKTIKAPCKRYETCIGNTKGHRAQQIGAESVTTDRAPVMSAMIAIAGLGLAWIIITVGVLIHVNLVLNMAAVEWVGRKQLGEYEPPASGT